MRKPNQPSPGWEGSYAERDQSSQQFLQNHLRTDVRVKWGHPRPPNLPQAHQLNSVMSGEPVEEVPIQTAKPWKIRNVYHCKPLRFGVFCYVKIDAWNRNKANGPREFCSLAFLCCMYESMLQLNQTTEHCEKHYGDNKRQYYLVLLNIMFSIK